MVPVGSRTFWFCIVTMEMIVVRAASRRASCLSCSFVSLSKFFVGLCRYSSVGKAYVKFAVPSSKASVASVSGQEPGALRYPGRCTGKSGEIRFFNLSQAVIPVLMARYIPGPPTLFQSHGKESTGPKATIQRVRTLMTPRLTKVTQNRVHGYDIRSLRSERSMPDT